MSCRTETFWSLFDTFHSSELAPKAWKRGCAAASPGHQVVQLKWWLHRTKRLKHVFIVRLLCLKPGAALSAVSGLWRQQLQMQTFHFIFHFYSDTLSVGYKFLNKFIFHQKSFKVRYRCSSQTCTWHEHSCLALHMLFYVSVNPQTVTLFMKNRCFAGLFRWHRLVSTPCGVCRTCWAVGCWTLLGTLVCERDGAAEHHSRTLRLTVLLFSRCVSLCVFLCRRFARRTSLTFDLWQLP